MEMNGEFILLTHKTDMGNLRAEYGISGRAVFPRPLGSIRTAIKRETGTALEAAKTHFLLVGVENSLSTFW